MSEEVQLATKQTALVDGLTSTKMGTAVVTSERIMFVDTKFMGGVAGGALGAAIAEGLQRRHEQGGPHAEIPLASITGLRREKKLLNKDRIAAETARTAHRTYLFQRRLEGTQPSAEGGTPDPPRPPGDRTVTRQLASRLTVRYPQGRKLFRPDDNAPG